MTETGGLGGGVEGREREKEGKARGFEKLLGHKPLVSNMVVGPVITTLPFVCKCARKEC